MLNFDSIVSPVKIPAIEPSISERSIDNTTGDDNSFKSMLRDIQDSDSSELVQSDDNSLGDEEFKDLINESKEKEPFLKITALLKTEKEPFNNSRNNENIIIGFKKHLENKAFPKLNIPSSFLIADILDDGDKDILKSLLDLQPKLSGNEKSVEPGIVRITREGTKLLNIEKLIVQPQLLNKTELNISSLLASSLLLTSSKLNAKVTSFIEKNTQNLGINLYQDPINFIPETVAVETSNPENYNGTVSPELMALPLTPAKIPLTVSPVIVKAADNLHPFIPPLAKTPPVAEKTASGLNKLFQQGKVSNAGLFYTAGFQVAAVIHNNIAPVLENKVFTRAIIPDNTVNEKKTIEPQMLVRDNLAPFEAKIMQFLVKQVPSNTPKTQTVKNIAPEPKNGLDVNLKINPVDTAIQLPTGLKEIPEKESPFFAEALENTAGELPALNEPRIKTDNRTKAQNPEVKVKGNVIIKTIGIIIPLIKGQDELRNAKTNNSLTNFNLEIKPLIKNEIKSNNNEIKNIFLNAPKTELKNAISSNGTATSEIILPDSIVAKESKAIPDSTFQTAVKTGTVQKPVSENEISPAKAVKTASVLADLKPGIQVNPEEIKISGKLSVKNQNQEITSPVIKHQEIISPFIQNTEEINKPLQNNGEVLNIKNILEKNPVEPLIFQVNPLLSGTLLKENIVEKHEESRAVFTVNTERPAEKIETSGNNNGNHDSDSQRKNLNELQPEIKIEATEVVAEDYNPENTEKEEIPAPLNDNNPVLQPPVENNHLLRSKTTDTQALPLQKEQIFIPFTPKVEIKTLGKISSSLNSQLFQASLSPVIRKNNNAKPVPLAFSFGDYKKAEAEQTVRDVVVPQNSIITQPINMDKDPEIAEKTDKVKITKSPFIDFTQEPVLNNYAGEIFEEEFNNHYKPEDLVFVNSFEVTYEPEAQPVQNIKPALTEAGPKSEKQNIIMEDSSLLPSLVGSSQIIKMINDGVPLHFSRIPEVVQELTVNSAKINQDITLNINLNPFNLGEINLIFKLTDGKQMTILFETSTMAAQKAVESYFQNIKNIVKDNSLVLHEISAAVAPNGVKPVMQRERSSNNSNFSNNSSDSENSPGQSRRKRRRDSDPDDNEELRVDI